MHIQYIWTLNTSFVSIGYLITLICVCVVTGKVVSCHVGAENVHQISPRAASALDCQAISPAPFIIINC